MSNSNGSYWPILLLDSPTAVFRRSNAESIANAGIIAAGVAAAFAGGFFPLFIQSRYVGSRRRRRNRAKS